MNIYFSCRNVTEDLHVPAALFRGDARHQREQVEKVLAREQDDGS